MFSEAFKLFKQYLVSGGITSQVFFYKEDTGAVYPFIKLSHSHLPLPQNTHNSKNNAGVNTDRFIMSVTVVGDDKRKVAVLDLVTQLMPLLNNASYNAGRLADITTNVGFRGLPSDNEFIMVTQLTILITNDS